MKTYISLKVRKLIKYIKKNIYGDCSGFVGLVVIGLLALGGVCWAGMQTDLLLTKARQNQNRVDFISNEIIAAKNNPNYDPDKLLEKIKPVVVNEPIDPQTLIDKDNADSLAAAIWIANLNKMGAKYPIEKAQADALALKKSIYLNEKSLELKGKLFLWKTMYHFAMGDDTPPSVENKLVENTDEGKGESLAEWSMRTAEEKKLWKMYSAEQSFKEVQKWNEEDKDLLFDIAQGKREDLLIEINNTVEEQKELAAEKAEIEKIGLQNYWLKKAKEKMQQYGILANENTLFMREQFFKNTDLINEMEKLSPPPDDLPGYVESVEANRKWLEENDPLFSNNKLIAWLNRTGKEDPGIDFDAIAEILKSLGTGTTEIAVETSINEESDESVSKDTVEATQPGESIIGSSSDTAAEIKPTEATAETVFPSELNLKGTMTSTVGANVGKVSQIILNINFETQIVSGTLSYSGPRHWNVWTKDENGEKVPGTEKDAVLQTTISGTIDGKIDVNNKIIEGTVTLDFSGYYEEYNETIYSSASERMLGSLDENNIASGTSERDKVIQVWTASPN